MKFKVVSQSEIPEKGQGGKRRGELWGLLEDLPYSKCLEVAGVTQSTRALRAQVSNIGKVFGFKVHMRKLSKFPDKVWLWKEANPSKSHCFR